MKITGFLKKWVMTCFAVLFFLLFIGKGCTSKMVKKTNDNVSSNKVEMVQKIDSLEMRINSLEKKTISLEEMKNIYHSNMYDFLVYEKDLDDHNISLSEIKIKLKEKK